MMNICSYNMHGFNNGLSMLHDLSLSCDIIALQKHWLCDNTMHKLSLVNDDFIYFGVSSIN